MVPLFRDPRNDKLSASPIACPYDRAIPRRRTSGYASHSNNGRSACPTATSRTHSHMRSCDGYRTCFFRICASAKCAGDLDTSGRISEWNEDGGRLNVYMGWHEMVSEGHVEKKPTRKKKKKMKKKEKKKKTKLEAASGTQKAERRKRNKQKKKEL